ncbi:MAG: histidine phosphatase family protein [Caldilineaceae bacterium]|nr:histidine phosphatase family protein [Caldilineaceae bacterium]
MTTLYLVRHGENVANLTKEFSHRAVDYSLTDKGRAQAAQTADYFRGQAIDAVYSSPLRRARETAEAIAAVVGKPVTVVEDFREINVGVLEGQAPTPELWHGHNQLLLAWFAGEHDRAFEGGESYNDLWRRAQAGYAQVLAAVPQGRAVIVAHGGLFTLTLKDLCRNFDPAILRTRQNHNCSISEVEADLNGERVQATLVDWANVGHISGAAADFEPGSPRKEYYARA